MLKAITPALLAPTTPVFLESTITTAVSLDRVLRGLLVAQSLQQQLAAAQNALNAFTPPPSAPSGPRYFARASQDCPCNKPAGDGGQERAQLEANLAKAQADAAAFLESVKNPGPDKLGAAASGAKVGPTW
jgi:hypothetical protein